MEATLSKPELRPAQLEAIARQFRVLGEASRLHLLSRLMNGPATVGELAEVTGFKQGNVSKQLAALHDSGFLHRSRDGNFVRYEIADPVVYDLCQLMCGRVGRTARERAEALGA
jgi:DNA-binding transcriptional ArsR family regulator